MAIYTTSVEYKGREYCGVLLTERGADTFASVILDGLVIQDTQFRTSDLGKQSHMDYITEYVEAVAWRYHLDTQPIQ